MYKLLAVLLLFIAYNAAHPGDRSGAEVLCSIKLNEMLAMVCEDMGYNPMIRKRSGSLDLFDYVDTDRTTGSNDVMTYPMVSSWLKNIYRDTALNSLTQTRRRQRGVVDECCKQSCSMDELVTYCNNNNNKN